MMHSTLKFWLFRWSGWFLLLLAFPVAAADVRADFEHFLNDTKTARMEFVQVTFNTSGAPAQIVEGTLLVDRPGKFRWETSKPYPQLIVGNGARVWYYDPDLNQVVIRSTTEALGGTPAALLAGSAGVTRTFTLKPINNAGVEARQAVALALPPEFADTHWLQAIPKDADAGFQEIRMGFLHGKLVMMVLIDAFAQKTVTHFIKIEENPSLAASLFTFTPPVGADVIGKQ